MHINDLVKTAKGLTRITDLFSGYNGVTITDQSSVVVNNHVFCYVKCSGSITFSANGACIALHIEDESLVPSIVNIISTRVNSNSSGQVYASANAIIDPNGYVSIYGPVNTTYGNSSYPWTTTGGMYFDYWL